MTDAKVEPTDARRAPEDSEDQLALLFADRHKHELRYLHAKRKWMIYREGKWHPDTTREVYDLARTICRERAARLAANSTDARRLTSAHTRRAVVDLARSDPRLCVLAQDLSAMK